MENMSFPRPFADRYGVNLTIAILAISPFIVVTTAAGLYRDRIAADLGAGSTALAIIAGLSIAGYAFGAMLGGYFIRRFPLRPLYFACEALCIGGCLLAALADGILTYGGGRVLFGFATGQLLVTALPPVIQRFPPDRMPFTAIAIDIGFFGAVTIGPLIGGVIAHTGAWRGLYGSLAGICAGTLTTALFTLPDRPAFKPDQRFDALAILLAFAATFLPFWATGELASHGFYSRLFAVPLAVGLVCLVVLLLTQYHQKEPLSPVKPMWHSYPIVGTMAAMFGGGAYITLVMLAQRYQLVVLGRTPLATGLAFWPQILGVLGTAGLLGLLFRTRFLPLLTLTGMLLLTTGGAMLLALPPAESPALLLEAIALLGAGAGAVVAPGLFMAGMSLPSRIIGPTFALVELIRSIADFILSPVLLQVARVSSGGGEMALDGIKQAVLITLLITIGMTFFGIVLYLVGTGTMLPRIDLEGWLLKDRPAVVSSEIKETFGSRR